MKKIYLAGAFKETEYRQYCKDNYSSDFELHDPIKSESKLFEKYDLKLRNVLRNKNKPTYPTQLREDIVLFDKAAILKSDYVIAYVNILSFGTIMEIMFAYDHNIPVYVVNPNLTFIEDVWLSVHSEKMFSTLDECFTWLKRLETQAPGLFLALVNGAARSGKDTVSNYLVEEYDFTKLKFATPIYNIVKEALNLDDKYMFDDSNKEKPFKDYPDWSLRKLLQFVGTEMFRNNIDRNIWVRNAFKRIISSGKKRIVMSDWRFPNEEELVNYCECDSLKLKVVRDGADGKIGLEKHESESYDLGVDHVIMNNSTIEDLYCNIDGIMKNITLEQ